ncbi:MAG TPA: alpha/beta hydrolase-fold protein [Acidimicrobiales bacterium]|nr:alpha/beta hydrolase-fold protein [Acidimicrobiales bacterium]
MEGEPGAAGALGLPWSAPLAGRLDECTVTSSALAGNPLGDPAVRPLWVYVPPGYDDEPDRRYPSVYVLQGYTGHVAMWRNRQPFRQPFVETADAAIASGACPPLVVVYVDAWTALGGSQFVDSPGTGRYHTYLCDEIVPWVDARYRTLARPDHRAVSGKSSGGYGAMVNALWRPDVFGSLATHAGDALFEACQIDSFLKVVRALRDEYHGSYDRFWAELRGRVPLSRESDGDLIETWAYAACYSAADDGTVHLPFDPATGALVPEVWQRWLDHDPVRIAAARPAAARSLRAVWIDAGSRDEWYLDLGATAFRDALLAAGLPGDRIRFELFPAGHMGIDYRYPLALTWLGQRISP